MRLVRFAVGIVLFGGLFWKPTGRCRYQRQRHSREYHWRWYERFDGWEHGKQRNDRQYELFLRTSLRLGPGIQLRKRPSDGLRLP